MKKTTIQQVWVEAWRRFRANWIPVLTLLPMPTILGSGVAALAILGISITVSQCSSRTSSSSVYPRGNIATASAFVELSRNNQISAPYFSTLGEPEFHDDYERVLDYAEKNIERYKDSLNNLMQQLDAISSKEIEEERDAKLREVDEWQEKMMRYANSLPYVRARLDSPDEFADFLYNNLGYEYKDAYMQGSPIKDWAIDNVKDAIQRVYQSKRANVVREYKKELSAIEQKKKEKEEEYRMALQSLESAKDEIKSARQALDDARVSFLKKSWVYLTSLILILIYVALLLVGFIWASLGTDQIALSVNRDGISSILGDILPKNPLKVGLSFLLFEVIYFAATIALLIIFLIFSFVLSFIFGGYAKFSLKKILSISKIPPSFVIELIILVVLIGIIPLVRWPSNFFILDGKSPLATLKDSILFFRRHWQKILLLKLSKNIILFTVIFYFLLYLGVSIGIPILMEDDLEKILRGVSVELSPLVLVTAFAVLWVLLCYLTVMEAQLYVMIRKEEEAVSPSAHALEEGAGSTASSSMSE